MSVILNSGEVGSVLAWTKSNRSGAAGHCVQAGVLGDGVAVSDSNNMQAGGMYFSKADFAAFVGGVKDGDFDHLTV